jgi:hypothetical protein
VHGCHKRDGCGSEGSRADDAIERLDKWIFNITMNYSYLLGGIACFGIGLWLTIYQIGTFIKGKQDELGWDIKGLASGIIFLLGGIYMLLHIF